MDSHSLTLRRACFVCCILKDMVFKCNWVYTGAVVGARVCGDCAARVFWHMTRRVKFLESVVEEPHAARAREILAKYPEIKGLMAPEWRTKYIVAGTVAAQVFLASRAHTWPLDVYACVVYLLGATMNHSLFLAIHEFAHNLGCRGPAGNKLLAGFANLAIGVPYSATFKVFHMKHHRALGEHAVDTDMPTAWEASVISGAAGGSVGHAVRKALYLFFYVAVYALRPVLLRPDLVVVNRWLVGNCAAQIAFNVLVVYASGWSALSYLLLSSFLACSIHPTAGHFIAEHYALHSEKIPLETYSYYGPLNYVTYNVGLHVEHHDFPNIPWSRLPRVREIAPEFYDDLPQCSSWTGAIAKYICDDTVGPFSRVLRCAPRAAAD